MVTIYHAHGSRSLRVLWTLEEIGAKAEIKSLPFPPRQLQPDYLAVNPAGTVPAMIDGDRILTESLAICEYLVSQAWRHLAAGARRTSPSVRRSCNGCGTANPRSCCRWA